MRQIEEATDTTAATPDKLLQWKVSLTEKLTKIRTLDDEILTLIENDAIDEEIEQADVFSERLQEVICRIEQLILNKPSVSSTRRSSPSATTPTGPPPASRLPSNRDGGSKVKLPKLTPKSFNGDLTKWESFWSMFESSIHLNPSLSAVDKFTYLHSLLEGPALRAIAGLQLTDPNYDEAIDTLKKRFGNKQQIISRHMDSLLELESVQSGSNIKALRGLYDQVEFQVRSLKSLEVPVDSYGNLLSSLLMNRLPHELRLIINRGIGDDEWNIDDLMGIVEKEISARERASGPSHDQRGPQLHTAAALLANEGQPKCSYCRQGHTSSSCTAVTDINQRKVILKRTGRCFVCLRRHHLSRDCRSPVKCTHCNGHHHTSICKNKYAGSQGNRTQGYNSQNHIATTRQPPTQLPPTSQSPQPPTSQSGSLTVQPPSLQQSEPPSHQQTHVAEQLLTPTTQLYCVKTQVPVLLQTAKAYMFNLNEPNYGMTVRLMLDGGSQRSYMTQRVKDELGLQPEHVEQVQIKTFGSETTTVQTVEVVRVGISLRTGDTIQVTFSVVPLICEPLSCQPIAYTKAKYSHLEGLDLADHSRIGDELQIDALIGSDYYWQIATGKVIQTENSPTAIHTHLGWVLSGPVSSFTTQGDSVSLHTTHSLHIGSAEERLDHSLKAFWDLESLGITTAEPSVYDDFTDSIRFDHGRYTVSLPWKPNKMTQLPSNFCLAKRRLEGLLKRLRQDPEVRLEYHAVMQEQLRQGIIEKVVDDSPKSASGTVHYLPHHAVIRRDKTTSKLRIVYDASARAGGPSLNDCLFSGPKFIQNIFDIILRFRSYKVALVADIEKAFLMVSVSEQDRDVLRFLWVDNVDDHLPNIVPMRFTRVVFGVSSSPFLLNATINHHLLTYQNSHPALVDTLSRSIYVDDVTYGADSDDAAYELHTVSRKIFAEGGFNLRKFVTSSASLQHRIDANSPEAGSNIASSNTVVEEDATYTDGLLAGSCATGDQKVLGVRWNPSSDNLEFDLTNIARSLHELKPTKRNIVGVASQIYDPLGFLSPVVITLKIFFQELCRFKIGWDGPLPQELELKWKGIVSKFHGTVMLIPRFYFASAGSKQPCSLYGFCDASTVAYGAVVYLHTGNDSIEFVASKTRVSPLHTQTIPRLELLSCLLLARLITHVRSALATVIEICSSQCFTDSMVALYWIKGEDKEWKQFVHNRVSEIRNLMPADHWFHCPGKSNPADMASRGVSPQELDASLLWRHGPDWLSSIAPVRMQQQITISEECIAEMEVKASMPSCSMLVTVKSGGIGELIDCKRFSTLHKLLRVTAYVRKFVLRFKLIIKGSKPVIDWNITVADIEQAEFDWILDSQICLEKDARFQSWKSQLQLFSDKHKLWRCGGRLSKADLPLSKKHPILLCKEHYFATLVTKHAHERCGHSGVKDTLTEVRTKYWFAKGRQFVRKILYGCLRCRKVEGLQFKAVPTPPLPEFRVKEAPPFSHCGVDYAGPLYVSTAEVSDNKVWICLFSCCVTRAIHLELVPDMSTQSFLRAFKRFTARRGVPTQVISDNAKTFVSAAQYLTDLKVTWSFNLEKAPWWGGFFERMVQSVKRCLKKTIGRAKLSYDELLTALTEAEAIVNSRPLSYLSSEDLKEPLTPSHLLAGRRVLSLPDGSGTDTDINDDNFTVGPKDLNSRLQLLTRALDEYWVQWRDDYLLELRERSHTTRNIGVPRSPIVGEVVVVHDEHSPRSQWKLGKVIELMTSNDGQVRGAVIKVITNGKPTKLRRPTSCLYPLEVMPQTDNDVSNPKPISDVEMVSNEEDDTVTNSKPVREAARKSRQQVHMWMTEQQDF